MTVHRMRRSPTGMQIETAEYHYIGDGIIWEDGEVHCIISKSGGFVHTLCGQRFGEIHVSWVTPTAFVLEDNQCAGCAEHEDLPMYLLGDE